MKSSGVGLQVTDRSKTNSNKDIQLLQKKVSYILNQLWTTELFTCCG